MSVPGEQKPRERADGRLVVAAALVTLVASSVPLWGEVGTVALPAPIATAVALIAFLFAIFVLLVETHRRETRLRRLSDERDSLRLSLDQDPLTGLMNRTAFSIALDELARNRSIATILVVFFDLDRFKDVNDTLGHKVGDHLLLEVARRAGAVLNGATAFARLGGDEFAAIIPCDGSRRPEDYGRAIVEAMNEPFVIDGRTVKIAASVGIAVGDALLDDGVELLRRADVAMYEAKGAPSGGYRVYDDVLNGRQVRESSIRVELGKSLIEQTFEMHYQAIVDARDGHISSAEALLRSSSSAFDDVPTSALITIAEESGQIVALTEWTLEQVLEAIRSLETTPVAINVSPVYFRHPDFVQRVFDKLIAHRTRPELLTVEVTEGVLIADIAAARHSIARLREIGMRVYLDDFGTGFSSLSYLQHFELDGLKLDKSFLREVGDRRKSTQIIRSIIDFGHSLDMRVVVEGVESDWQARLLQLLGCDFLQGYELGVPMPLAEFRVARDEARVALAARSGPIVQAGEAEEDSWAAR